MLLKIIASNKHIVVNKILFPNELTSSFLMGTLIGNGEKRFHRCPQKLRPLNYDTNLNLQGELFRLV